MQNSLKKRTREWEAEFSLWNHKGHIQPTTEEELATKIKELEDGKYYVSNVFGRIVSRFIWIVDGKLHRLNGPAAWFAGHTFEISSYVQTYYIEGVEIDAVQFKEVVKQYKKAKTREQKDNVLGMYLATTSVIS